MKVLVLGVGNPILSDDGVGIHVARALKEEELKNAVVEELPASGLEFLDVVLDYDRVIIVDAILTKNGKPGDIHMLEEDDFEKAIHGASPHGVNIATALALGRKIVPDRMPKEVSYIAIEAEDVVNVSEKLTKNVAKAVPKVVSKILEMLA